ncbi:MAG: hypothetical protein WBE76_01910 [Terracidiphilus sp.]
MRMTHISKLGMLLMAIAFVSWGGWTIWDSTRTWFLVKDVPISLSNGNHYNSGVVKTNMDALYSIDISADYAKGIDANHQSEAARELACQIGLNDPKEAPCQAPPEWKFHWMLSSDKSTVQGDSDETIGEGRIGPAGSIDREIGTFKTKAGHRYKFDLEVLFNNQNTQIVNPHLMVAVADFHTESSLFLTGLIRIICALLAVIGLLVTLGSLLCQRLKWKRAPVREFL